MGIFDRVFRKKRLESYRKLIKHVSQENLRRMEFERLRIKSEELRDEANYLCGYNDAIEENRPAIDEPMEELEVVK